LDSRAFLRSRTTPRLHQERIVQGFEMLGISVNWEPG